MDTHYEKVKLRLLEPAGAFINLESNRTSLITATGVELSDDQKQATILISVFPTDREEEAIHFLRRHRTEFREYIKEHSRFKYLPFVDFDIDEGEKKRQRVDELLNE